MPQPKKFPKIQQFRKTRLDKKMAEFSKHAKNAELSGQHCTETSVVQTRNWNQRAPKAHAQKVGMTWKKQSEANTVRTENVAIKTKIEPHPRET